MSRTKPMSAITAPTRPRRQTAQAKSGTDVEHTQQNRFRAAGQSLYNSGRRTTSTVYRHNSLGKSSRMLSDVLYFQFDLGIIVVYSQDIGQDWFWLDRTQKHAALAGGLTRFASKDPDKMHSKCLLFGGSDVIVVMELKGRWCQNVRFDREKVFAH